jgi:hypothetical protein
LSSGVLYCGMPSDPVKQVARLVEEHYVFPEVGRQVSRLLAAGDYPEDAESLARAVTADMQSVNGDKHLRLLYHREPLPEAHGEDEADLAEMRRWADRECGGVAKVERLPGNVGHLDLRPLLFPAAVAGEAVSAALTLVAGTAALLIDLRGCVGGEPSMVALLCSYLFDHEPVELSGTYHRDGDRVRQLWTLAHVPGRRFGPARPVYVLTSAATFSGAEALGYDLQQLGRATVVGERTRGGAHPRRAFRIDAHLEATIPVARAVSPITGTNWEGTGIVPDVHVPADEALPTAYRMALERLRQHQDPATAEERAAVLSGGAAVLSGRAAVRGSGSSAGRG